MRRLLLVSLLGEGGGLLGASRPACGNASTTIFDEAMRINGSFWDDQRQMLIHRDLDFVFLDRRFKDEEG